MWPVQIIGVAETYGHFGLRLFWIIFPYVPGSKLLILGIANPYNGSVYKTPTIGCMTIPYHRETNGELGPQISSSNMVSPTTVFSLLNLRKLTSDQWNKQSTNQSINQSINQSSKQASKQAINQSINQSTNTHIQKKHTHFYFHPNPPIQLPDFCSPK